MKTQQQVKWENARLKVEQEQADKAELYHTFDVENDTNTIESTPESEPDTPNKAQHSPEIVYSKTLRTIHVRPTFNEALQGAKELIGFFANGDNSHVANEAKALWYAIDNVQQGKVNPNRKKQT